MNLETRNTIWRLILYSFACLTFFSPLILGYGSAMEANLHGSETALAIEDPLVSILILVAASILIPGLLDNLLDYWFFEKIDSYVLERSALISGLFISYAGQFLSTYAQYRTSTFIIFFVVNICTYYCLPLIVLYRINRFFSTIPVTIILSIFYCFTLIGIWGIALGTDRLTAIGSVLRYTSFTLVMLMIFLYFYYEVHCKRKKANLSLWEWTLRSDVPTQNAFIIVTSFMIVLVVSALPTFLDPQPGLNHLTDMFLRTYFVVMIVFLLMMTILPLRLVRRETEIVQADLQNKKQFVR